MKKLARKKITAALLCAALSWQGCVYAQQNDNYEVKNEVYQAVEGMVKKINDGSLEIMPLYAAGNGANASGGWSTAVGDGASSSGDWSTAVGHGASASGDSSTAVGEGASASYNSSAAIGQNSRVSAANTVSFGKMTDYSRSYRNLEGIEDIYVNGGIIFTADGAGSNANLQQGELRGVTKINGVQYSSDTNNNTYSIGNIVFGADGTNVQNIGNILFDSSGNVDGEDIKPGSVTTDKVTVGDATTGTQTVIDGSGTVMTKNEGSFTSTTTMDGSSTVMTKTDGSTTSTTTTEAGSIKVSSETTGTDGSKETSSVSIADGDIELSKTGADGKQQTIKVGEEISSIRGDMDSMRSDINAMGRSIDRLGEEIDEVGALSAALAGLHPNPINANSRADFAMAVGSYDGESAIAAGAFYRPDKRTMLSLGASATSGNQMFNMGVTFALDKLPEKENTNSEVLQAVLARLDKLEAENAELKAQVAAQKEADNA